jgi:hypothetical protein
MVVWVKADAVDAACNQRALVLSCNWQAQIDNIRIKLLGTDGIFTISHKDIVGCELDTGFSIFFDITGLKTSCMSG